jgi:hypothetical protein
LVGRLKPLMVDPDEAKVNQAGKQALVLKTTSMATETRQRRNSLIDSPVFPCYDFDYD